MKILLILGVIVYLVGIIVGSNVDMDDYDMNYNGGLSVVSKNGMVASTHYIATEST